MAVQKKRDKLFMLVDLNTVGSRFWDHLRRRVTLSLTFSNQSESKLQS